MFDDTQIQQQLGLYNINNKGEEELIRYEFQFLWNELNCQQRKAVRPGSFMCILYNLP